MSETPATPATSPTTPATTPPTPAFTVEDLRKVKLFVATPMYGGMSHGLYVKSCLDLQALLLKYGVEVSFSFMFNESLITRARNYMVDEFLKTDCTHMLFIDSDIQFNAQDVVTLLASGKEVIGGPYPKKAINWENIAEAIRREPDIPPSDLARLVGKFVFNPVAGTTTIAIGQPLEVLEIGTGFMLIKREVFDKMMVAYPQLKFKQDYIGQNDFNPERYIHVFFDTVIDTVDSVTGGGSDRYLSEDYMFCQLFRKMGGKIFLCPWMQTRHVGTYDFAGDMPFLAQKIGKL